MTNPYMHLTLVTIVVHDYDAAIAYYTGVLGFVLLEDTVLSPTKRWVRVAPSAQSGCAFLLAQATTPAQHAAIGNQAGDRVAFFLHTDDFTATYSAYQSRGVAFREAPRHESYGWVVQFTDAYGNRWDLLGGSP